MVLDCELSVSFLDLVEGSILLDAKGVVELLVVHLLGWPTSSWHTWERVIFIVKASEWEAASLSSKEHS